MEFAKINNLIYETLEKIAPIETSRVSMFCEEDKYSQVPFCRFRFKNKNKDDEIYKKIKRTIDKFVGNVKWKIETKLDTENYLIFPILSSENDSSWNDKDSIISIIGKNKYYEKIDFCIEDIIKLSKEIDRISK